ncbi:hypothetical protein TNCV_3938081 [Trichonephila clavipes]|nr:hypothetical protein TNCV_3938081 [Trichonephila clavipes]
MRDSSALTFFRRGDAGERHSMIAVSFQGLTRDTKTLRHQEVFFGVLPSLKQNFKLIFCSLIFLLSVKNQRTKQALCKTSLAWNTNDAQKNNGGDRWSTPATTHMQHFVSIVFPDRPF